MKAAFYKNNIPSDLRKNDNWVNQELTWNKSKSKFDKKPRNSRSGMPARWKDTATWSSFEDADKLWRRDPNSVPAYIMTEADNLICIDLDHCCDQDGNLKPYAHYLVDQFQSYTERSVSGDGIHIFVSGTTELPKDVAIIYEGEEHEIEVFTKGRIMTMTGLLLIAPPSVPLHPLHGC